MRKGYTDLADKQIHWRMWGQQHRNSSNHIYCLHPTPYSGLAFSNIAKHLSVNWCVIALDYPGYGGSTSLGKTPRILDFVEAVSAVKNHLSPNVKVSLIGFHTGCLVAMEYSILQYDDVSNICLIDIPAFDAATRQKELQSLPHPYEIPTSITQFEKAWSFDLSQNSTTNEFPKERGFELFTERLLSGRDMNSAFHAAFSYDWKTASKALIAPSLVIATDSFLKDGTLEAAKLIPQSTLIEKENITNKVLDLGAAELSIEIDAFFKKPSTPI